jgi:hypothetical protein
MDIMINILFILSILSKILCAFAAWREIYPNLPVI